MDVSTDDPGEAQLNRQLVEHALKMALLDDSEVHIVHAWFIYGEYYLWNYNRMEQNDVEKIIKETKMRHKKQLTSLVKKCDSDFPEENIHLIKGEASDLIPAFTKNLEADLLVMGTIGRTGLQGLIIGNTAEKVLQSVNCSVLAVKPKGFISPITLKNKVLSIK